MGSAANAGFDCPSMWDSGNRPARRVEHSSSWMIFGPSSTMNKKSITRWNGIRWNLKIRTRRQLFFVAVCNIWHSVEGEFHAGLPIVLPELTPMMQGNTQLLSLVAPWAWTVWWGSYFLLISSRTWFILLSNICTPSSCLDAGSTSYKRKLLSYYPLHDTDCVSWKTGGVWKLAYPLKSVPSVKLGIWAQAFFDRERPDMELGIFPAYITQLTRFRAPDHGNNSSESLPFFASLQVPIPNTNDRG